MNDEFGGVAVEDQDEFGGVLVADEFGGKPVEHPTDSEIESAIARDRQINSPEEKARFAARIADLRGESPEAKSAETRTRLAFDAAEASNNPAAEVLRPPTLKERIGQSVIGDVTGIGRGYERELQQKHGAGPNVLPQDIAGKAFEFSTPPPPVREAVTKATDIALEADPSLRMLPESVKGTLQGARDVALQVPFAAGAVGMGKNVGRALLGIFTGEYVWTLPEQKAEFDKAMESGDTRSAARIATSAIAGGALLGAGISHEAGAINTARTRAAYKASIRGINARLPQSVEALRELTKNDESSISPVEQKGATDASSEQKAATVYGDLQSSTVEGQGDVPVTQSSGGVLPREESSQGSPNAPAIPAEAPRAEGAVTPAQAKKEFHRLVEEYGEPMGWITNPTAVGDLGLDVKTGHGTGSIKAKIARGKELSKARRNAIKELGGDIDAPDYPALIAKLKEQVTEAEAMGTGTESSIPSGTPIEFSESSAAVPKLAPGEKGTGDLLKTVEEPLRLVGETGVDLDARAAEQAAATTRAAEAKAIQEQQQPALIGMGGAIPEEFARSPQTPTGIKNATVDVERAKRGLPPAIQPLRKSFGEVWDRAMARIDRDPASQDRLLDEVREKPRALTDEEDAMLLHRQVDLQNDYGKATRDLAQAFEDGRTEDAAEERIRIAELSDKLLDVYNIGKKVGTETGRGLNARKMMAYEDFSLAEMELQTRAAKGGRPLSDSERAELTALHEQISATQKAYDDYVARTDAKIARMQVDAALHQARAQAKIEPTVNPYILSVAEKIVANLDRRADAARARIKERGFRFSTGIDPTVLIDVAEIGASHIAHVGLDLAKWSARMVEDFGEAVKPHLDEIWKASQGVIDNLKAEPKVKRAIKKQDVAEKITATTENISEKVKAGKKDEVSILVQKLARHFIETGIKEREAVIDAVHGVLQKIVPEITRRETMDAISGYGDFKQLSKDQISVQLRGIKGEMQQIAKLEDMAAGIPPSKTGIERRTPTDAERKLIKAVNEAKIQFQVPITDPATQLKSALDARKTQLINRAAELREKLAAKDFAPKPRRELRLDAEALRLKAEAERAKLDFKRGLVQEQMKQRTLLEKTQDTLVKWRRGFLLSSPVTLAKLTSAGVQRMAFSAVEEGIGGALSKIIPSIASKATREGGLNTRAEAKAITEGFTKGMRDAWQTLKTGQSDLDVLYGKQKLIPQEAIDFFGQLHGALKAPTKRNEFSRSFEKRTAAAIIAGIDVTDPMVQTRLAVDAYKDANRSIFMQDNRVVSAYKRGLSAFDAVDKSTGKVPASSKAIGTVARVLLPIVKIPTNIVAETIQYATGTVTGSARLANAFRKGIETLPPEQAELIMRDLKKGSLGAAVMLTGYLLPNVFGGYYQPGQKRDKKDVKFASARIAGVNIPSALLHNPLLETAQLGATIRRVADSKMRKKDTETQGLGVGVMAGALGLLEEVPFVREMMEIGKAFEPHERGAFFGELAKSVSVPQLIEWIARQTDKDSQGEIIQRKPTNMTQHIKMAIPGLRQDVPGKKK